MRAKMRTVPILAIALVSIPFAAWRAYADHVNSSVREASRQAVQKCADQVTIGASKQVQYTWKQLCNKSPDSAHPEFLGDSTDYVLTRDPDRGDEKRIGVTAEILLDIFSEAELAYWETAPAARKRKPRPKRLEARDREAIVNGTRACLPYLNRYWDAYGVDLRLVFNERATNQAPTVNTIQIVNGAGRSNSRRFYYGGLPGDVPLPPIPQLSFLPLNLIRVPSGPTSACFKTCGAGAEKSIPKLDSKCSRENCAVAREQEYCSMVAHEIGHRLGLPDEYAEPVYCRDRQNVSQESLPFSMMAVPQPAIIDSMLGPLLPGSSQERVVEFFERHVTRVVGPLCGIEPAKEL